MKSLGALALTVALLALTGCMSVTESFPGHDPDHVWTALVAVAETPTYDDDDPSKRWWVKENQVWVDDAGARIEIYRELDRMRKYGTNPPIREQRSWRLQVVFDPEGSDGPTARIRCRDVTVPMRAVNEGHRYFADVRAILEGAPATSTSMDDAPGDAPDTTPIIDVDALEPH